jgi:tripartite-type tricarboxylate transporter receptor subunit TctC
VTTTRRVSSLPDVPTLIESGYPDFDYHVTYGVVAPADTPPAIVAKLNAEIRKVLESPDTQRTLGELNVHAAPGSAEQFAEFLAKERAQWARAVKASGATVD